MPLIDNVSLEHLEHKERESNNLVMDAIYRHKVIENRLWRI